MSLPRILPALFALGLSHPALAAEPAAPAAPVAAATVTMTDAGAHVLGSPAAPHRLIEYVSYTCPHCATFAETGDPALKAGPVARGTMSVEVRPVIRNGFDIVASVLARCGPAAGFFDRHHAIMTAQPGWLPRAMEASQSLEAKIRGTSRVETMTLVAKAAGLDAIAAGAGVTPEAQAACFADESHDRALMASSAAAEADKVPGTPSFLLDGTLLEDVHDWDALAPRLDALGRAR